MCTQYTAYSCTGYRTTCVQLYTVYTASKIRADQELISANRADQSVLKLGAGGPSAYFKPAQRVERRRLHRRALLLLIHLGRSEGGVRSPQETAGKAGLRA